MEIHNIDSHLWLILVYAPLMTSPLFWFPFSYHPKLFDPALPNPTFQTLEGLWRKFCQKFNLYTKNYLHTLFQASSFSRLTAHDGECTLHSAVFHLRITISNWPTICYMVCYIWKCNQRNAQDTLCFVAVRCRPS